LGADHCVSIASELRQNCVRIASELRQNCVRIAPELHQNCARIASELRQNESILILSFKFELNFLSHHKKSKKKDFLVLEIMAQKLFRLSLSFFFFETKMIFCHVIKLK
jgi:hypothetical protein